MVLLILVVGAGMYLLGRRHPAPPNSTQGEGQTAQATLDGTSSKGRGRHLAPHDTFYLLQYVSVKEPTGVIGFEPGQEVHLVEVHRPTQTLVVGDGTAQVEVSPDKLTNDMDMAALVRQKDQVNQAKIAAYVQSEQKAYEDSKREAAIKTENALDKIDQQKQQVAAAANTPKPNSSAVGGETKLDEPPVAVGGTSGYGYEGSAYYGSPYSYFAGSTASVAAPAAGFQTGGNRDATVGGGTGRR